MKKLICFVLIVIMALSVTACGKAPAGEDPSGDNSTPVEASSTPLAASSQSKANDSVSFPLTFKPIASMLDVRAEDNPDVQYSLGYGGAIYDSATETVIEYCKDENDLYIAINGSSDWPAELNSEWKGYGYTAIETKNNTSIRTLAVGKYGQKHASVIRQHEDALYKTGFESSDVILHYPEDESLRYVDYCMLVADGEVTIDQIAKAAYEALYMQTWLLIPAEKQGVQLSANGKTYTVSDILAELAG